MRILIILIELLGTFFLAVEAIKLENLKALRETIRAAGYWLFPIEGHRVSMHGVIFSVRYGRLLFLIFTFGLAAVGFAFLALHSLYHVNLAAWSSATLHHAASGGVFGKVYAGLLIALWAVIWSAASLLLYLTTFTALFLLVWFGGWIEAKTPNGVVGITGFCLFVVSAVFKLFFDA